MEAGDTIEHNTEPSNASHECTNDGAAPRAELKMLAQEDEAGGGKPAPFVQAAW